MVTAYLPDIMKGVVDRVNTFFSTRLTDPFSVYYDRGVVGQVKRSVYNADANFPLIWFVMPYRESFEDGIVSEATFQLIIAMPTDNTYTQQQREDISFIPRLMPIYHETMTQIDKEKWFPFTGGGIVHTREILPYWGMGDVEGPDQANLFDKFVDAISINITGLKVDLKRCEP